MRLHVPANGLRVFRKVYAPEGQTLEVHFVLSAEDMSFYDHDLEFVRKMENVKSW